MCDAFWDEVRGPCTERASADCKVAVAGAAGRHGSACVQRPMFRNAPPLIAYVCSGAIPPGLVQLCPRPDRGSSAKPAGAPTGQDTATAHMATSGAVLAGAAPLQDTATARMATSGAVLASAGLYGVHRLYRRATAGKLPGRAGRWAVHRVGDPGGEHINDIAAIHETVEKIVDPEGVYSPLGIESALVNREGFNRAKDRMVDGWYKDAYSNEHERARNALADDATWKLATLGDYEL